TGDMAVITDTAGAIQLVSLATLEPVPLLGSRGFVWDAVWSPDGRAIATSARDRRVRIWPVPRAEQRETWLPIEVHEIMWSRGGKALAIAGHNATYRWQLDEPEPRAVGAVSAASQDGQQLAIATTTGVDTIDLDDGR